MLKAQTTTTQQKRYHAVVDFGRTGDVHRFFLLDMQDKKIEYSWYTSHGSGSGAVQQAVRFSNTPSSHMSSLGLYKTAEVYQSTKFGRALRLEGLDDTNSNARRRAIVFHRSWYVSQRYMKTNKYAGRSQGCITADPVKTDWLIDLLKEGSLIWVTK